MAFYIWFRILTINRTKTPQLHLRGKENVVDNLADIEKYLNPF